MNIKEEKWYSELSAMSAIWIGIGVISYFIFMALLPPPFIELPHTSQNRTNHTKIEVIYYFWYGCKTCYEFEDDVSAWAKKLPADVHLTYTPLIAGSPWDKHGHLHYTLVKLGLAEKLRNEVYKAIHTEKKSLETLDEMSNWAVEHGVDRDSFLNAYNSKTVHEMLNTTKQLGDSWVDLDEVPAFVVDGYLMTDLEMSGWRMLKIVDELIDKSRKNPTSIVTIQ